MANKYWVGGGSSTNWNATGNTNWSDTDGGANNATAPGTGDVVIFNGNSGSGNSVLNTAFTVQNLDCSGYAGTLTHNTSVTLTLNTSGSAALRFSSGMTYTPASTSSLITFTHTSGTATVTSNGKRLAALTINGVGGTTSLADALLVNVVQNAILTVTNGVFDANGAAITACLFQFSNSNVRSVILGGDVTIGGNISGNQSCWFAATTTNLTFTKNSANIIILAPTSVISATTFQGGTLTYNGITVNAATSQTFLVQNGSCTFSSFSLGSGWSLRVDSGVTVTISAAFTWVGTQLNPIMVFGGNTSSAGTLSCPGGSCSLTWGALQQTTGAGGATFTATNCLNFGSVTGWTVSQPDAAGNANSYADALLDRSAGVETGLTPRQALRLISSTVGAKLSGAGTATEVFRDAVADSKNRVTATVDVSGNRTAITYDLT